jgi:hypothetical protein
MAQSAMQIMYEEMMCYEYTIPLELIVRCKELIDVEKEQIMDAYAAGSNDRLRNRINEQYYNENYGGKDL